MSYDTDIAVVLWLPVSLVCAWPKRTSNGKPYEVHFCRFHFHFRSIQSPVFTSIRLQRNCYYFIKFVGCCSSGHRHTSSNVRCCYGWSICSPFIVLHGPPRSHLHPQFLFYPVSIRRCGNVC
jgi:hypothetical protein